MDESRRKNLYYSEDNFQNPVLNVSSHVLTKIEGQIVASCSTLVVLISVFDFSEA